MKPSVKFQIQTGFSLNEEALRSLTLLYQPIIGAKALSLFLTLQSLAPKEEAHHLLIQMLNVNMSELIELRHRLEACGLLDVYEKDGFLSYVIKTPLTPQQFLSDGIMNAFLYVKVGERDFVTIKESLICAIPNIQGDRMTKKIDDVFDVRVLGKVDFDQEHLPNERLAASIGIEMGSFFDEEILILTLKHKGICSSVLTPSLLRTLNKLAYLYKFDVHEMAHLIHDSIDPCGEVDVATLRGRARKQFQLINARSHVEVVVKERKSNVDITKVEDGPEGDGLRDFLAQSPMDFLRFKSEGKPPVPADMKLVEWLTVDQQMPAGVINVLVEYVLDYTDGNLPKQLVEKLAGQWQRKGIKTVEAATAQVEQVLKKSDAYKKEKQTPQATARQLKHVTRSEPIPEWFGKNHNQEDRKEDAEVKARFESMKRSMLEQTR